MLARLVEYLQAKPMRVLFDAESAQTLPSFGLDVVDRQALGERSDLVIVVAGDGTFLSAARSLVAHDVPLLGINLGRLGFLTDIKPDEMAPVLDRIFAGQFVEERRLLLNTSVTRQGAQIFEVNALNEVVVQKWNIARLIEFETFIDSKLVNSQRSDGLIVATPTGSTAYALSGGGPILEPNLRAFVLVPICPHTLSSRPIVVDAQRRIEVVMSADSPPGGQLTYDGRSAVELVAHDRIFIHIHRHELRLIHPPDYDYYATLRAKLHWAREL